MPDYTHQLAAIMLALRSFSEGGFTDIIGYRVHALLVSNEDYFPAAYMQNINKNKSYDDP